MEPASDTSAPLTDWIGRTETAQTVPTDTQMRLMQATLDQAVTARDGDPLPPLWHWLLFPPLTPTSGLGPDGHTRRGGFLPPVALPRRMWAGGQFRFFAPLVIGKPVQRRSEIVSVAEKAGRSGPLCFVTVRHVLTQGGRDCVEEHHDIVYRDMPTRPEVPAPAPVPDATPSRRRQIVPSMPLLFRYSALTFNGHRIHYDIDYCRQVEGYPGCIVHGPLIATLLAGLCREGRAPLATFRFRATAPLFHTAPFHICAADGDAGTTLAWAETPRGGLAMTAEATHTSDSGD